jgi:hypothetical protein
MLSSARIATEYVYRLNHQSFSILILILILILVLIIIIIITILMHRALGKDKTDM